MIYFQRSGNSNTYTAADCSTSFTTRSPDDNAPCIHENHGERCSPAKYILPSGTDALKKSVKPTNAQAPRDHSSSVQHFETPRSKFSRTPEKIPPNCFSVLAMRSFSLSFAIISASPGLAYVIK